jgi:hypothetical protein
MHQFARYVRPNHVAETPRNQRRKTEIFWTQMEKVCINDMCFFLAAGKQVCEWHQLSCLCVLSLFTWQL